MTKKVTELKQINFWLTDDGKLNSSMKTHVAMHNSDIDIVWIKYKNTLASNNDACICVDVKKKKLGIVKKYKEYVLKNKHLMELVKYYEESGFTVRGGKDKKGTLSKV